MRFNQAADIRCGGRVSEQGIIGFFCPVPMLVPIHGVVASGEGRKPHRFIKGNFCKEFKDGSRFAIFAVGKRMDADACNAVPFSEFNQRKEMIERRMRISF